MLQPAPITNRRRKGKEQDVAAGHKGVRQPARLEADRAVAGQRRVADPPEHAEIDEVIDAEPFIPLGKVAAQAPLDRLPAIEFNPMALAVIESDRLHARKSGERPGQAGRRILPARKQHKRRFGLRKLAHGWEIGPLSAAINKPATFVIASEAISETRGLDRD